MPMKLCEKCWEELKATSVQLFNDYENAGMNLGELVGKKQLAYGDSFGRSGEVLRQMFPGGIPVEKYDDMLSIVRVVDKLFRIANQKTAFDESPWQDIAGYALLNMVREEGKGERSP